MRSTTSRRPTIPAEDEISSIIYSAFDGGIDLSRPSNIQDANRFRRLKNAYVTPGKAVRKRPGARYRWSWGPGVKGLYPGPGYLTGFWGDGNADVQHPTAVPFVQDAGQYRTTRLRAAGGGSAPGNVIQSIETAFLVAGSMYAVATTDLGIRHHYASGTGDTAIVDDNCPQGATAIPIASKVFGGDAEGVVRFSKTDDPANWTATADAGFLPTNRKTRSLSAVAALGEFNGLLVVSTGDAAQLWEVDPDPAMMRFSKTIAVGQVAGDTGANVGADFFFLSQPGVRSIVLNSQAGNAMDLDVGVPVDRLALELMSTGSGQLFARYLPSLGQFWLVRGARALVYSFSRTAKVYAWSEYEFPWSIAGVADFAGGAYLRSDAGDLYQLDADYPYDDDAGAAVAGGAGDRNPLVWSVSMPTAGITVPTVLVESPFYDMKSPASLKQIHAMDVVTTRDADPVIAGLARSFEITHLFRSDSGGGLYEAGPIVLTDHPDDSRPGGAIPVGLMAPSIAARLEHQAGERFELSALVYHFDNLGVT